MSSDKKYQLQNRNSGQSTAHNYYQRAQYQEMFQTIWNELIEHQMAQKTLDEIRNSALFKFSPYKSLTIEQYRVAMQVISLVLEKNRNQSGLDAAQQMQVKKDPIFIKGAAGTGKTVLAVFLAKAFSDLTELPDQRADPSSQQATETVSWLAENEVLQSDAGMIGRQFRIGLVIPVNSMFTTLRKVFKELRIKNVKVLKPVDVVNDKDWDLLIVDEAHRLKQRKNIAWHDSFIKKNEMLQLDRNTGNQLDWILLKSRFQILMYDQDQSVMPSDVPLVNFQSLMKKSSNIFTLDSQMRCLGGNDYLEYIKAIFSQNPPDHMLTFSGCYTFVQYESAAELQDEIVSLDQTWGLCRLVAGYGFDWPTKKYGPKSKTDRHVHGDPALFDFVLDGRSFIWNSEGTDWVNSKHALQEVGCVHTIQGYDLNYVGVIIGPEIIIDPSTGHLGVDLRQYHDRNGKVHTDPTEVQKMVMNIYQVLCTRGIRGTLIYAANPEVRDYLSRWCPMQPALNCPV